MSLPRIQAPRWLLTAVTTLLLIVLVVAVQRSDRFGSPEAGFNDEAGWQAFRQRYGVEDFGADGYFVRAVRNGYNLFYHTERFGWRFTRKDADDRIHSCAGCHSPEDIAYGFVVSDRYDQQINKRVSFEERVMRCYASPVRMDGYVPTIYDPAVRDLRIFARIVAHALELGEGQLVQDPSDKSASNRPHPTLVERSRQPSQQPSYRHGNLVGDDG